jgi:integrase
MPSKSAEGEYFLSLEEINRIINAAPTFRDRVIIEVLASTGLRRAELRDLKIDDINFESKHLYVREGKGKKPRTLKVSDQILRNIKQLIGNRTKGNIFTSPKSYPNGLSLKQINEIVAKCSLRAGVRHPNPGRNQINPHLFRHSFVRQMLRDGVPIQYVQKMVGHASIKTTVDIYGTPSQLDIDEAYEKALAKRFKK